MENPWGTSWWTSSFRDKKTFADFYERISSHLLFASDVRSTNSEDSQKRSAEISEAFFGNDGSKPPPHHLFWTCELSNEKKGPWLVHTENYTIPSYTGIVKNHYKYWFLNCPPFLWVSHHFCESSRIVFFWGGNKNHTWVIPCRA